MSKFGTFSGSPIAEWLTDPEGRLMRLLAEFTFIDPAGRIWIAPEGSVVDGASIPSPLWSMLGSPYTGKYRFASIVHDVACENPAIDRLEADKMFYQACLAGGCDADEARLLYVGVRIGASASKIRVWEGVSFSAARLQSGTLSDGSKEQSVVTTFEEIKNDIANVAFEADFAVVVEIVEKHLFAKAIQ